MNEKVSLRDWLQYSHTNDEFRNLFYGLHAACHELFDNYGAVVPYLDCHYGLSLDKIFSHIYVDLSDPSQIAYPSHMTPSLETKEEAKNRNIEFLTTFAVGTYLGYDYHNGLLNREFLETSFDEVKQFLPAEDVPYYENVILKKDYSFYDTYVDHLGKGREVGYQMIRGGISYGDPEKKNQANSGFSQSLFLSLLFFVAAILSIAYVFIILK